MLRDCGENQMIKGLIVSIQFLTRIPINKSVDFNEENIKKSLMFFAPIGLLLGSLASLPFVFLYKYSISIAAALSLFIMVVLTGGLHLDGLSDTCDGFFSGREVEKIKEIMKDSRIGAFGVIGIVFILMFKLILLMNLDKSLWIAIPLSMANARLIVSYLISEKKTTKTSSLGKMFNESNPKNYVVIANPLYIVPIMIIKPIYIIPLLACFLFSEIITRWTYKKIGGFTGDVYGASIEIFEVISLLLFWGVSIWS